MNKMHVVLSSAALSLLFIGCGEWGEGNDRTIEYSNNRIKGLGAKCQPPADVYVSPTGSDTNLGTRTAPLRTLEAARDAARKLKKVEKRGGGEDKVKVRGEGEQWNVSNSSVQPSTSNLQPHHTICLLDGTYRLERPLALEAQDSGVVWRAENRGKAVLSGGTKLDWRKPGKAEQDRLALLPAVARNKVRVASIPGANKIPGFLCGNQLAEAGQEIAVSVFGASGRYPCARWPNGHDAMTKDVFNGYTFSADIACAEALAKEPDPWVFGLWSEDWIELTTPFQVVDAKKGVFAFPKKHEPWIGTKLDPARPFYVFNAFAALDEPGEWVIDRERRMLWIWPEEQVEEDEISIGDGLVRARGLSDVTFDGLVFERTRLTALKFWDAVRVKVVASTFRQTSSWGVEFEGGSDSRVEGCDFYDLGEGGVNIDAGKLETLTPGNHVVANCHFHHLGKRMFAYRSAVKVQGVGNRVEHNLIHHLRHAAILFGGNDQYIGWNVIHDVCASYDAGAIYAWQNSWVKRGGTIEHNLVHVSGKTPNPTTTMGIYLDDYTSDVDIRHNIVDFASYGLMNGGGQCNRWVGNVILNAGHAINVDARGNPKAMREEVTVKNGAMCGSELWRRHYPNLHRYLETEPDVAATKGAGFLATNNVFAGCGPVRKLSCDFEWNMIDKYATLTNNFETAGDPGFADYAGFDWRAAGDSPAQAVIAACRFEKMGLYDSPHRASPAVKFGPDMTPAFKIAPPPDAPDITIWADFDTRGDAAMCATNCFLCKVIPWELNHVRALGSVDLAPERPWHGYRFVFTPEADSPVAFRFCGSRGIATDYRNIRIVGADVERPVGDKVVSGRDGAKAAFKVNVKKGVPVEVRYEARKGE